MGGDPGCRGRLLVAAAHAHASQAAAAGSRPADPGPHSGPVAGGGYPADRAGDPGHMGEQIVEYVRSYGVSVGEVGCSGGVAGSGSPLSLSPSPPLSLGPGGGWVKAMRLAKQKPLRYLTRSRWRPFCWKKKAVREGGADDLPVY